MVLSEATLLKWMREIDVHPDDKPHFLNVTRHDMDAFIFIKAKKIAQDVVRTRANDSFFRRRDIRVLMNQTLVSFCAFYRIDYMQGLNEVLAPTLLIERFGETKLGVDAEPSTHNNVTEDDAYDGDMDPLYWETIVNSWETTFKAYMPNLVLFEQIILRLAPAVFKTFGMSALQSQLVNFQLLFSFHDPELSGYLRLQGMTADVYTVSWFITLFSRKLEIPLVLHLWIKLTVGNEAPSALVLFIAVALLRDRRSLIFDTPTDKLPQLMVSMQFASTHDIDNVFSAAIKLYKCTPRSTIINMHILGFDKHLDDSLREIYLEDAMLQSCLEVDAEEVARSMLQQQQKLRPLRRHPPQEQTAAELSILKTISTVAACQYLLLDCGHSSKAETNTSIRNQPFGFSLNEVSPHDRRVNCTFSGSLRFTVAMQHEICRLAMSKRSRDSNGTEAGSFSSSSLYGHGTTTTTLEDTAQIRGGSSSSSTTGSTNGSSRFADALGSLSTVTGAMLALLWSCCFHNHQHVTSASPSSCGGADNGNRYKNGDADDRSSAAENNNNNSASVVEGDATDTSSLVIIVFDDNVESSSERDEEEDDDDEEEEGEIKRKDIKGRSTARTESHSASARLHFGSSRRSYSGGGSHSGGSGGGGKFDDQNNSENSNDNDPVMAPSTCYKMPYLSTTTMPKRPWIVDGFTAESGKMRSVSIDTESNSNRHRKEGVRSGSGIDIGSYYGAQSGGGGGGGGGGFFYEQTEQQQRKRKPTAQEMASALIVLGFPRVSCVSHRTISKDAMQRWGVSGVDSRGDSTFSSNNSNNSNNNSDIGRTVVGDEHDSTTNKTMRSDAFSSSSSSNKSSRRNSRNSNSRGPWSEVLLKKIVDYPPAVKQEPGMLVQVQGKEESDSAVVTLIGQSSSGNGGNGDIYENGMMGEPVSPIVHSRNEFSTPSRKQQRPAVLLSPAVSVDSAEFVASSQNPNAGAAAMFLSHMYGSPTAVDMNYRSYSGDGSGREEASLKTAKVSAEEVSTTSPTQRHSADRHALLGSSVSRKFSSFQLLLQAFHNVGGAAVVRGCCRSCLNGCACTAQDKSNQKQSITAAAAAASSSSSTNAAVHTYAGAAACEAAKAIYIAHAPVRSTSPRCSTAASNSSSSSSNNNSNSGGSSFIDIDLRCTGAISAAACQASVTSSSSAADTAIGISGGHCSPRDLACVSPRTNASDIRSVTSVDSELYLAVSSSAAASSSPLSSSVSSSSRRCCCCSYCCVHSVLLPTNFLIEYIVMNFLLNLTKGSLIADSTSNASTSTNTRYSSATTTRSGFLIQDRQQGRSSNRNSSSGSDDGQPGQRSSVASIQEYGPSSSSSSLHNSVGNADSSTLIMSRSSSSSSSSSGGLRLDSLLQMLQSLSDKKRHYVKNLVLSEIFLGNPEYLMHHTATGDDLSSSSSRRHSCPEMQSAVTNLKLLSASSLLNRHYMAMINKALGVNKCYSAICDLNSVSAGVSSDVFSLYNKLGALDRQMRLCQGTMTRTKGIIKRICGLSSDEVNTKNVIVDAAEELEAVRLAAEEDKRAQKARIAAEELEAVRLAAEEDQRAQKARIAAEELEAVRLAAEEDQKAQKARIAAEELEAVRLAAEEDQKAQKARIAAEELEAVRLAAEEAHTSHIAAQEAVGGPGEQVECADTVLSTGTTTANARTVPVPVTQAAAALQHIHSSVPSSSFSSSSSSETVAASASALVLRSSVTESCTNNNKNNSGISSFTRSNSSNSNSNSNSGTATSPQTFFEALLRSSTIGEAPSSNTAAVTVTLSDAGPPPPPPPPASTTSTSASNSAITSLQYSRSVDNSPFPISHGFLDSSTARTVISGAPFSPSPSPSSPSIPLFAAASATTTAAITASSDKPAPLSSLLQSNSSAAYVASSTSSINISTPTSSRSNSSADGTPTLRRSTSCNNDMRRSGSGQLNWDKVRVFTTTSEKEQLQIDMEKQLDGQDIEFVKNMSDLTPEGMKQLDKLIPFLLQRPSMKISIEGHTNCGDSKSQTKKNAVGNVIKSSIPPCGDNACRLMSLSQQRVETVKAYFQKWGCENEFSAKGWGCTHPVLKSVRIVRILPT